MKPLAIIALVAGGLIFLWIGIEVGRLKSILVGLFAIVAASFLAFDSSNDKQ